MHRLKQFLITALAALALAAPSRAVDPPCVPLFERELDPPIPVYGATGPESHPWQGGWERPRPQLLDFDDDGDLDLFANEEDGQLRHFRNDGTLAAPSFVLLTDDFAGLHDLYFSRLVDLDADQDYELLVEAPPIEVIIDGFPVERPGAFLYINQGSPQSPVYVNESSHPGGYWIDDAGVPITFFNATPDFTDLDGDGDLDLLFGDGGQGGYIVLYRNLGTPQAPIFHFETGQYRGIAIVAGGCNPARVPPPSRDSTRHGFMLFNFADVDADADPDLFVGDQFISNSYFLENLNTGAETSPDFICRTEEYFPDPSGGNGFSGSYFLSTFGDLDGDGDLDALMGSGITSDLGLVRFTNDGTPQSPSFSLTSTEWLPELDLGRSSAPTFGDIEGDGVLDLLVGVASGQRVTHFANVGSSSAPAFALFAPVLVQLPNASWSAPEIADLDADGDFDLFAGTSNGAVRYWRNDAGPTESPEYVEIANDPAFGITNDKLLRSTIDEYAVPRFFDEEGDGDLDLLVGCWNFTSRSTLMYFRNDGTPQAHSFVFASADYRNIGVLGQNLAPAFGDFDGDADLDLVVGNLDGHLTYVRNLGPPNAPRFHVETRELGGIDVGSTAVPSVRDLDGDGDFDLLVGETGGGFNFYRNVSEVDRFDQIACDVPDGSEPRTWTSATHPIGDTDDLGVAGRPDVSAPRAFSISNVYPSPSRERTWIEFSVPREGRARVAIVDALGRRVATLTEGARRPGSHVIVWDGRTQLGTLAAPGVYQAIVTFEGDSRVRRFVRLR